MAIGAPVLLGDVPGFGPFVAIAGACVGIPLVNAFVLSRLVFQTSMLDRKMRCDDGSELTWSTARDDKASLDVGVEAILWRSIIRS